MPEKVNAEIEIDVFTLAKAEKIAAKNKMTLAEVFEWAAECFFLKLGCNQPKKG